MGQDWASGGQLLFVLNRNGEENVEVDVPDRAGGGLGLGGGAVQLAGGELPRLERPRHFLLLLLLLLARFLLLQQPALHLPAYLISTRIPYYQPYGIGNLHCILVFGVFTFDLLCFSTSLEKAHK